MEETPEVEKQEEEKKEENGGSADKGKEGENEEPDTSAVELAPEASPEPEFDLDTSTETSHRRQPSLSAQSKMRSSSFRRSSVSQPGNSQTSASHLKSPPLPPLTPDGETMPELFRKQAVRLEELEKENKKFEKELQDAEDRWKKSEEELDDLREANGEVVELKDRMERAEKKTGEVEKLVSITALGFLRMMLSFNRNLNLLHFSGKTRNCRPKLTKAQVACLYLGHLTLHLPLSSPN